MRKFNKQTLAQRAVEKYSEFTSKEAMAVVNDLITCMNSSKSNLDMKLAFAKVILLMPKDICPEKVTKKYIARLLKKLERFATKKLHGYGTILIKVFVSFMRRGLYNHDELGSCSEPELLSHLEDSSLRNIHILKNALNADVPFSKMRLIRCKGVYQKKDKLRLLTFDTKNQFLQDLMVNLSLDVWKFNEYVCHYESQVITSRLAESFGDLPVPTDIMGFTPDTFRQQVLFFVRHASFEEVGVIKALYLHIIQNFQGEDTPFTAENGIDIGYISRNDVVECLKNGYRTVELSSLKEPPSFDNWLVSVKNHTDVCGDILRKNSHMKCSFQDIPLEYKNLCKRWLILENKITITNKVRYLRHIKLFLLELMNNHQKIQPLQGASYEIRFQDVISFLCKSGKVHETARASIALFLSYLKETGKISVDPTCFKYMPRRIQSEVGTDKQDFIPQEDYEKLVRGLRYNSEKDNVRPIDKISLAMFVIMSLMELRPTSLLALRLSDIVECGSGDYYLTVATKTSRSHQKLFSIPPIVYEILQKVIEYTATYRMNVPQNVQNILFVAPNGKVITTRSINNVIGNVCRNCGIKEYTLRNVRKTYMTVIAKSIRDSGKSTVGYEQLFDHKTIETSFRAYARITKEEILMTICSKDAVRPEVKIKEHVKQEVEMDRNQLVSDEAGYCQNEFCHTDGMADCYICQHFITSVSFYDAFLRKREKITKLMATEGFGKEIQEGYGLILNILDMYISAMDKMRRSNVGEE